MTPHRAFAFVTVLTGALILSLLLAVSALAQTITGGPAVPSGGAVGGSCTTVNAVLKRAGDQTIGCSAVIDNSGAVSGITTQSMSGALTSTVATGTAPFVIASTTRVSNLNVAVAGTADVLTTARTINGTSFDGSANITITAAAGTLTGTTLNSTVVTSSLTSAGATFVIGAASTTRTAEVFATSPTLRLSGNATVDGTVAILEFFNRAGAASAFVYSNRVGADNSLSLRFDTINAGVGGTALILAPSGAATFLASITASTYLELPEQAAPTTPTNALRVFADSANRFSWKGENGFVRTFDGISNTADRVYTLPDLSDTLVTLTATQSLTNKKLGSLTTNGFVKTSAGDGTLSVDTATYTATSRAINTTSPITGGGDLSADRTIACATCGVTGSPLSQFAATTSAQLAGVISDEIGSGNALFGDQAVLVASTPRFARLGLGQAAGATVPLSITGPSGDFSAVLVNSNASSYGAKIQAGSGSSTFSLLINDSTNATTFFNVRGDGHIFMPAVSTSGAAQSAYACFGTAGEVVSDSVTCLVSSSRYKERIRPLDLGLATVLQMRPVGYYQTTALSAGEQPGFLAEDVYRLDPRLASLGPDGLPRSVRYEQYTAVLTHAIQELAARVEALEMRTRSGFMESTPTAYRDYATR